MVKKREKSTVITKIVLAESKQTEISVLRGEDIVDFIIGSLRVL